MGDFNKQELNPNTDITPKKKISRKEAIKKVGKYAAFTAASLVLPSLEITQTAIERCAAQ